MLGKGFKATIVGSLVLTVPDAAAFINDTSAKDAVAHGIADAFEVPRDFVTLTVTPWTGKMRRLGDAVTVEYTVTIPASASSALKAEAPKRALAVTLEDLSTAVQKAITAAKGENYIVSVDSKTVPKVSSVSTIAAVGQANLSFHPVRYHWLTCMFISFAWFLSGSDCSRV